jgi:hypothetical protein
VRRAALPVLLSCVLAGLALAPQASADHTTMPASVTLVGSLQSELGCPGDWQPGCAATALQPVDGRPGVFRGTFDVPAGSFEYKVAVNGSWDENYGAGGAPGGSNLALAAPGGPVTFTYDHATHAIADDLPEALGPERAAHWVRADLLAWDLPEGGEGRTYRLHASPDGGLEVQGGAVTGGTSFDLRLRRAPLPESLRTRFPHLAGFEALELPAAARREARGLLTGQLIVAAYDARGDVVDATGVQIPGVLDDLYASAADAQLGPSWPDFRPRLALWAPTAKRVDLLLDPEGRAPERRITMRRGADGVWRARGNPGWRNARYAFDVTVYVPSEDAVVVNRVTDPYSLGLTTNSRRSVLVDLRDPDLEPEGWRTLAKPTLAQPEDSTIYELHVRDFSISDETVPEERRGTYLAFAESGSDGMRHLRGLAEDGLNSLHLLPVNDISSIEEDRSEQAEPECDLDSLGPASPDQQACIAPIRDQDGFNWGYDPLHYTTPEGSYATDPDGPARTREFREMVKGINGAGLRVIMDVVYNHTPASGQDPRSILGPHRPGLLPAPVADRGGGDVHVLCEHASEHRMMEKLMVESVVAWARHYKVDGFRFDLMGHHSKANMLAVPARPRRADAGPRRGRRQGDLRLRRGLELRRGGQRRALRAGHPAQHGRHGHRDVLRPPARRRPRRRAVRRRPAGPGLRERARARIPTGRRSTGRRPSRPPGCSCTTTRSRSGWPGTCGTSASSTGRVRRSRAPRWTTTASPRATRPTRARRSPTSTPTTTRRCSTPCSTSCPR